MDGLRRKLEERRARRYRRRRWRSWRRRKLVLRLLAAEFDLANAREPEIAQLHRERARKLESRLAENARKLFR